MTREAVRDVRVLLDRYLEVSNHYARELRNHLKEYKDSPSRLSTLIGRLEAIEASSVDTGRVGIETEEAALGQNIVRTADTLAALRQSANEILERLEDPLESVPRNLWWLRKWLQRDVLEIAAGFPSFTYAWDKMIDLNRLTLAPDSRLLRIRDDVTLAAMEFERFVLALRRLTSNVRSDSSGATANAPARRRSSRGTAAGAGSAADFDSNANSEGVLRSLCSPLLPDLDPVFNQRVERVLNLLSRRRDSRVLGDSLEHSAIERETSADVDALVLVGLELGFARWLGSAALSKEHRKTIIMSSLVYSKLFLIERSWRNANDFSGFALRLTAKMNDDLKLDAAEGTPMLRFNQFWARYKLGEPISEELEQWDVSRLHPRYSFLKSVLLRRFDDAARLLEMLLPKPNSGKPGNFSMAEAEEWPILEDFRSSNQYEALKARVEARSS